MTFSKKVLVAGTGKSGIEATNLLSKVGAKVVLFDENEELDTSLILEKIDNKDNVSIVLGSLNDEILDDIDICVISPGIAVDKPFTMPIRQKNIPIWSEIELAYKLSSGRQIAAITGTNGKTTTTTLVGEIFKAFYSSTFVVGNIGIPYTAVALDIDEDSRVAAEISSFQLETIIDFKPKVSAVLNVTPDHLNRHYTMENYANTKLKVAMNQTENEYIVLNYDDEITREMKNRVKARCVYFSRLSSIDEGICLNGDDIVLRQDSKEISIVKVSELKLLGGHNIENVMAAIAITYYMGVDVATIHDVCASFMGVEHRIEYVATVNGVDYYNDSKGTNPDAAIKGIDAMTKPTLLIGGGYDKKVPFDDWVKVLKSKTKLLVLIGQTADIIAKTCDKYGFTNYVFAQSLEEAVDICYKNASSGDVVLLSPACASWGMFKCYEQRGEMFKDFVKKLGD